MCKRRRLGMVDLQLVWPLSPLGRRRHRPSLLEALAAIHGTPLRRLEGNRGFLAALRAGCFCLRAGSARALTHVFGALALAGPAAFGLAAKALVCVEGLFAGGENEFATAIGAFQNAILVLHRHSRAPRAWWRGGQCPRPPNCTRTCRLQPEGPVCPAGSTTPAYNVPPWEETALLLLLARLLVVLSALLLAQTLSWKRLLGPALFSGLHVVAVLFDFFDDVFLLHLALKSAQGVFKGLTFLDDDFRHAKLTSRCWIQMLWKLTSAGW